jgi:hypothetical protein
VRRTLTAAALACAAALAVTGCDPKPGPAGTVVGKEKDYKSQTKSTQYRLTVETPKGKEEQFRVTRSHYEDCAEGDSYPKCTRK